MESLGHEVILSSGGTAILFHNSTWIFVLICSKVEGDWGPGVPGGNIYSVEKRQKVRAQLKPIPCRRDGHPVFLGLFCVYGLDSEESRRVWK